MSDRLVAWTAAPARWWRLASTLLLAAVVVMVAAAPAAGAQPLRLERGNPLLRFDAELAIVEQATPPGDAAHWQAVELPDLWSAPERWRQGIEGWYRIRLPGPAPAESTSVLLWRFSMNAAVWFNGEFVGDGGSFGDPLARNWNRPLMWRLSGGLWRAGDNELLIRLRTHPGFGHLMPVYVGPTDILQPEYERRMLTQINASQVAAGVALLALLSALVLWGIDRRDTAPLHFAGASGLWFVYAVNAFWRDVPLPAGVWSWAVHSAVDASYAFLMLFFHRQLGARHPARERLALAFAAVCALVYALVDLPTLARLNPLLHGITSLIGVYLVAWLARQWWRRRSLPTALLGLLFAAVFAASLHDQLLNARLLPGLWRSGYYIAHLVLPLLFLGTIALLALRSAANFRAVRQANETLEARVQAARGEMAEAAERERELLAGQRVAAERERIYRDLHDNLGAKLLSLVYGARDDRQAAAARDALAEMRNLIAAGPPEAGRLSDLAPDWRLECELRCEDAGLALQWQQQGDAMLGGRQRYQLDRMLRELVSNAIEHAGARTLAVAWRCDAEGLDLDVADDGRGVPDPKGLVGHGIEGLRQRARIIGASIAWAPVEGGGLRARIHLPWPHSADDPTGPTEAMP